MPSPYSSGWLLRCIVLLLAMCLGACTQNVSPLVLDPLFTDHAVFQAGSPIPVRGMAGPNQEVQGQFAGQTVSAKSGPDGRFELKLSAVEKGGPYELVVSSGGQKLVSKDILVGEVWLCSGQSNMEAPLTGGRSPVTGGAETAAQADLPSLRMFSAEKRVAMQEVEHYDKGAWVVCNPETAGGFAAVPFFFGRELHQSGQFPVGLVEITFSGSPISPWIPNDAPISNPQDPADQYRLSEQERCRQLSSTVVKDPHCPGVIFNGMIAPAKGFPIRGIAWYQGESDVTRSGLYGSLLQTTMTAWREYFGSVPILIVGMPNHGEEDWAGLRRSQFEACQALPDCYWVETTDQSDDDNLHPPNKTEVGRRLALRALETVYGSDKHLLSPVLERASPGSDGGLKLKFSQVLEGHTRDFFWLLDNGQRSLASVELQGDVALVAERPKQAVALEYGWNEGGLQQPSGLPLHPFVLKQDRLSQDQAPHE